MERPMKIFHLRLYRISKSVLNSSGPKSDLSTIRLSSLPEVSGDGEAPGVHQLGIILFQFNIVFGILLAYLSNYIVGTIQFGPVEWRWKFGVPAVPALFFLFLLFGIPRSPRWLVKKQRITEARDVLRMTGEQNYEHELQEIIVSIDAEHGASDSLFSWKSGRQSFWRYPSACLISSLESMPSSTT
jgi:MFS family permease